MFRSLLLCTILLALSACQRDAPAPPEATTTLSTPVQPVEIDLADVVETTDRYIIGINFPASAGNDPGLAQALKQYAQNARNDVMQALAEIEARGEQLRAPYDLSLNFTELHVSPKLVVIAADGSSYTGGAHGAPLVERFVWLPQEQSMLGSRELFAGDGSWQAISDYVRKQLHGQLTQRAEVNEMEPGVRADMLRNGGDMINAGSGPEADNFDLYEPVVGDDGRITAIRFVFPPYQVGPYSDGTQAVQIPAKLLLPYVAPAYRGLFAGATPASDSTQR